MGVSLTAKVNVKTEKLLSVAVKVVGFGLVILRGYTTMTFQGIFPYSKRKKGFGPKRVVPFHESCVQSPVLV